MTTRLPKTATYCVLATALLIVCARTSVLSDATKGGASAKVTGPITATSPRGDSKHGYPLYSAPENLAARGYVEEEFFIEGNANRYKIADQATATVQDSAHHYKTRFVVRRPASSRRFNGTVLLEWDNVSGGRDLELDWFQAHEHIMREGYAWVGVSAQRVGVEALKVWSPQRYGSLDITDGGTVMDDALSYDAFSAVAQAVRLEPRVMNDSKVERIFATGHSQSAGRLAIYVNSVHPLAPVVDAVVLRGGGMRIRPDTGVKVWKLLAETDVLNQAALRQPDSDNFHTWEVAGTSHGDFTLSTNLAAVVDRDGSPVAPGSKLPVTGAGGPASSHIPFYYVMDAAYDHLVRWVRDGVAPPSAPPIEVLSVGPPAVIVRDSYGNSQGGIRLPTQAVPTAVNSGEPRLDGTYTPFDQQTLAKLYPSHAAYVEAIKKATAEDLKKGYLVKSDAEIVLKAAEASKIGSR